MKRKWKKLNIHGFSMPEMLTAVAILIILCAVAIPSVITLQRHLRIAKMDAYARQIFLSAQNELTGMKASGDLYTFDGLVENLDTQSGRKLTEKPQDFSGDDGDWNASNLYYLNCDDAPMQNYLVRADESLETATENGGYFIVELNPGNGDIYGVFYAEQKFSYQDIRSLTDRTRSSRMEKMLGYYGGSFGNSGTVGLPSSLSPQVTVDNGEELTVNVSCSELLLLKQTKLSLLVTVQDEHGNKWEKTFQGGTADGFTFAGDSVTVPVVLDSLKEDSSFAKVTFGSGLVPGDNLTIAAVMTYDDPSTGALITGSGSCQTNSLFAGKDEDGNLTVSSVRHLNNLRAEKYLGDHGNGITITQTKTIDFSLKNWKKIGDSYPSDWTENPLKEFTPIANEPLMSHSVYDGAELSISNFPLTGKDNVGLFSTVADGTLQNVRLTDFQVTASGNNVGTLVGSVENTEILNCGVYLNSVDEYGLYLGGMDEKRASLQVTGRVNVGGLIGETVGNCTVSECFGAVDVSGDQTVGGLIGYHTAGTVSTCYASGDVSASYTNGRAGGLIGAVGAPAVSNCYATSDVSADAYAGGLIGTAGSGTVSNCRSFGKVTMYSQTDTADTATSGGLAGSGSAAFQACTYLKQADYNSSFNVVTNVSAVSYSALLNPDTSGVTVSSYPYNQALVGNFFPFEPLKVTRTQGGTSQEILMTHYGDWPAKFQLQTSLVYYEKYLNSNGSYRYGYYALTSLTSKTENSETQTQNNWIVDSLDNDPSHVCVEDGYALMTMYSLTDFDCALTKWTKGSGQTETSTTTQVPVTVSETAGANRAVLLEQDVSLKFEKTDASGQSYYISNAKVYQLPFELQMTGRTSASRFFDKLMVTGHVNQNEVFTNYIFYYCPDFAKNAINPDFTASGSLSDTDVLSKEPNGVNSPVYVRSPRQLNLLGRTQYYWSKNNSNYDFYYLQEKNLDYDAYTKEYCGHTYDLMDVSKSNQYRNMPIGCPNTGSGGGQFKATYDGAGNPIIDYRCHVYQDDTAQKYEFVGLFGEVCGATLKNIVMTASDPANGSGSVVSEFNNKSNVPGVGALAGLIYIDQGDNSTRTVVQNCAVSGYTVSYQGSWSGSYAVGGLVGFNFGDISNCSAVSAAVTAEDNTGKDYLGGLTGSLNGRGTIVDCYAGGVLSTSGETATSCGGISGGFNQIYGHAKGTLTIQNSYSYCTFTAENLGSTPTYSICPTSTGISVVSCAYLAEGVLNATGTSGAEGLTSEELSEWKGDGFGAVSAENTHPWSESLKGKGYPYPAAVTDPETKKFVHYGDWTGSGKKLNQNAYLTYYENYGSNQWGYYTLDANGQPVDTLDRENARTIQDSGYGILVLSNNFTLKNQNSAVFSGSAACGSKLAEGLAGGYTLYTFSDALNASMQNTSNWNSGLGLLTLMSGNQSNLYYLDQRFAAVVSTTKPTTAQIRTAAQMQNISGWNQGFYQSFEQTHNITALSETGMLDCSPSAGNYAINGNGNTISGLTKPLINSNSGHTLKNIRLADVQINLTQDGAALCVTNNGGTITQCSAVGTVSSSQNAAGLVFTNYGTVSRSYANCAVTSTAGNAAGLVYTHYGTSVADCYASGSVTANQGIACGFEWTDWCNSISRCYTTAAVSGKTAYGFIKTGSSLNSCFWLKGRNFNTAAAAVNINGLTACRTTSELAGKLTALNANGTAWALDPDGSHTELFDTLGGYPYPYLIWDTEDGGMHCGNWSTVSGGKIGAAKVYSTDPLFSSTTYGLNGISYDLDTGSTVSYTTATSGSWMSPVSVAGYAIIYDADVAAEADKWTVRYYKNNGNFTPYSLDKGTDRSVTNTNADGLTVKQLVGNVNIQKLVFTYVPTGETYTFQYSNNSFTYSE